MDSEEELVGQEQATDTTAEATPEVGLEESEAEPKEEIQPTTFTQEQVNKIVQERLQRANEAYLKKYGVTNEDEFTSVFEKGRSYDDLKTQYDALLTERKALADQITLSKNNVLAEKQDDVLTYFKGKGLEMSDEALKQVLTTHPEWVKAQSSPKFTTVVPMGADKTEGFPKLSEEEQACKLFGFDRFY